MLLVYKKSLEKLKIRFWEKFKNKAFSIDKSYISVRNHKPTLRCKRNGHIYLTQD